jgi:hypothetical protein
MAHAQKSFALGAPLAAMFAQAVSALHALKFHSETGR